MKKNALRWGLLFWLAGASFMQSSVARAAEGEDVVMLSNGGRVRGTVIEQDPRSGVRIKLLDGTIRSLTAAEVREVQYGSPAGVPSPAPTPPAAASTSAPTQAFPAASPASAWPAGPASGNPADARERSAGLPAHKWDLGLRFGYALPLGNVSGSDKLSDAVSGEVPIWFEVGYRFSPAFMFGTFFQYAFTQLKAGVGCPINATCSGHDTKFGIQGQYHFLPEQRTDPWLGVGIGYETFSESIDENLPALNEHIDGNFSGVQFLNLQAGVDFRVASLFSLGPFLDYSLGEYSTASGNATIDGNSQTLDSDINDTALHEWFTFGLRGTFGVGD
jgi:hypothetical protein